MALSHLVRLIINTLLKYRGTWKALVLSRYRMTVLCILSLLRVHGLISNASLIGSVRLIGAVSTICLVSVVRFDSFVCFICLGCLLRNSALSIWIAEPWRGVKTTCGVLRAKSIHLIWIILSVAHCVVLLF